MSSNTFEGQAGYWASSKSAQAVPRQAAIVARHLRHIAKQELGYVRKVEVWRRTIDPDSGHEKYRKRKVNRTYRPMRGSRGFVVVNDGLHHAEEVGRLLVGMIPTPPDPAREARARRLAELQDARRLAQWLANAG